MTIKVALATTKINPHMNGGIYEAGIDCYPFTVVLKSNISLILWMFSGTLLTLTYSHYLAKVFLIILLTNAWLLLRLSACSRCYYYGKTCCSGMGKLAGLVYEPGDIEDFNQSVAIRHSSRITFGIVLVPYLSGTMSLLETPSSSKLVLLFVFFLVSTFIGRPGANACEECKMKNICAIARK